jgi:hypothetical protein
VKRWSLHPTTPGWVVGTALLIGLTVGQALAAGTIAGKLTAPSGHPVSLEGTRVNATDDKFHAFRVEADANGTYEITDLEPGKYSLVVVSKGLETVIVRDLEVKDGQTLRQDFTLQPAKPFPIVYSPKPIPLTEGYNSASFQDAPEILVNEAWQVRNGSPTEWPGPSEVSAKFKLKYSDQALHLAGDISFKTPGVNNADRAGNQLWNGNSIEFFWQNDVLDLTREVYHLDHNWQVVVTLADPVEWILYQRGEDSRPSLPVGPNILRQVKPDKKGEFLRWDMPFAIFLQKESNSGPISAPKLDSLGALDITINAADTEADPADAGLKFGLSWSGFSEIWQNPSFLRPIKFTAQP